MGKGRRRIRLPKRWLRSRVRGGSTPWGSGSGPGLTVFSLLRQAGETLSQVGHICTWRLARGLYRRSRVSRASPPSLRPRLEPLEDRRLLAAGDLDLTFGTGGIVATDFGTGDIGLDAAVQPDGKLLVAGQSNASGTDIDLLVARYANDGTLDPTFGTGGWVSTPVGPSHDYLGGMAMAPDGKIVLAGNFANGGEFDSAVVRYSADGIADESFGTGGIVTTNVSLGEDSFYDVTVQLDGKIVAVGYAEDGGSTDFLVVRYNGDGSLDTSFGVGGIVLTPIGAAGDSAEAVVVQPDTRIVVAGYADMGVGAAQDFAVVRYNSDGSLDTSFGGDGIVTTAFGSGADISFDLALQPDGKILVAGYTNVSGDNDDFAVARYNPDGSLDSTFDLDGRVTTQVGARRDLASRLAIQPDGKIVVSGHKYENSDTDFAVVRYDVDGSLDTAFSGDGIATTTFGPRDNAWGMTLDLNNNIVLAGSSDGSGQHDFVLVRYDGGWYDFGDAPSPYPTLLADNGPRHDVVDFGPRLGVTLDGEYDGLPDAAALGDDTNFDDENGVTFTTPLTPRP